MSIDWTLIITSLISALFGGGIGVFFTYRISNRKQDQSDFTALISEYKEMVNDYKSEVVDLRKEVIQLRSDVHSRENEIKQLRTQLMIFESSNVDIPIPIWLKDTDGKMLFVNPEYERLILHPIGKTAEDYIGSMDGAIWPKHIADVFQEHDRKVMRTKKATEFMETWVGSNNVEYEGRVIKYPRFLNRTVIGVGGIIIESNVKDKNI